jgi:hypothetical protein
VARPLVVSITSGCAAPPERGRQARRHFAKDLGPEYQVHAGKISISVFSFYLFSQISWYFRYHRW